MTNDSFDTNGVLYAIGSNFGTTHYSNPFLSKRVFKRFSADGANYYSTAEGHKVEDSHQASEVLCEHRHRGQNATQWSKGQPGAWFVIDLGSPRKLAPPQMAYRNDYGGGGNHPRSFELEGSNDYLEAYQYESTWVVLSSHDNEKWKGKQAKSWRNSHRGSSSSSGSSAFAIRGTRTICVAVASSSMVS